MRIKQVFEASGMTKVEVCNKTGLSRVTFDSLLKGDTNPRVSNLESIASVFNVPCGALFDDWQEPSPPQEFFAFIRVNGKTYNAESLDELKAIVNNIKVE